jgi:hypothetical protein
MNRSAGVPGARVSTGDMPRNRNKSGPTIPQMIALLDNLAFRRDAVDVLDWFRRLNESASTQQEWDREFQNHADEYVAPFVRKWGVLPPTDRELVESDSWREVVFCILTGRWGVIPVFPWTRAQDISKSAAKIRQSIKKVHKDAEGRRQAMIATWIRMHPSSRGRAPRAEIAAAVWGRKDGLRRPSRSAAIRRLSVEQEAELLRRFTEEGLSRKEAELQVYKRAQGSEAPAVRMVRAAESRLEREQTEFNDALQSPKQSDKTAYFLTMLLREIFLNEPATPRGIFQQGAQLRDHLLKAFSRY